MEWFSKDTKRLILEMTLGICLYTLVLCILAFILMSYLGQPLFPVLTGIIAGSACSVCMLVHIGVNTERALDSQSETYANKTVLIRSLIRKLVYIGVLLVLWGVFDVNLLAIVIGTMGMKTGAYLQPFIHKLLKPD